MNVVSQKYMAVGLCQKSGAAPHPLVRRLRRGRKEEPQRNPFAPVPANVLSLPVPRQGYRPGRARRRTAATAVEFAIVANLFFFMIFACIEFCHLNLIRNLVQDAAFFACRASMVPGATIEEAEAEANRILDIAGTRDATVTVNDGQQLQQNTQNVTVTVTVPIASNSMIAYLLVHKENLVATSTMRTERYDGFFGAN